MNDLAPSREELQAEVARLRARVAQLEAGASRPTPAPTVDGSVVVGFFAQLMQHAPMPIYVKSTGGRFLLVNRAWEEVFGLRQEAVVGRLLDEFLPASIVRHFLESDQRVIAANAPQAFEECLDFPTETRWFHTVKFPLRNAQGQIEAVGGVSIDITDGKAVEQAVRDGEARKTAVLESALDAIIIIDAQGWVLECNPAAEKMFGYLRAELIGTELAARILPAVARERHRLGQQRFQEPGQPLELGKLVEMTAQRHDGSEFPVELALTRVPTSGAPIFTVLVRDIGERKQAEAALRESNQTLQALFIASPLAVITMDFDSRVWGWNPAAERIFGWNAEEVLGKIPDYTPPEKQQERQALFSAIANGETITGVETMRRRKDGSLIDIVYSGAPLYDAQGAVTGILAVVADITERKRLEEQLRHAQKMEAIGQLAGGVAHDFNNLLTAILGNASLLLAAARAGDPHYDLLRDMERAAARAAELTGQLLGFSRQTLLRLQPADLNAVIDETVAILRHTIDPRIQVAVEPASDLWTVQADPGQMNQVLMNLCLNARDAMPEGGRLSLQTANVLLERDHLRRHFDARAGEFVRLRVRDSGGGIPVEIRTRIFDPFFTTKEPGKGTGLGLAMVFGIVKQHQGWIECQSEVGKGTDFDIYLPRCAAEPAPPDSPPPVPAPAASAHAVNGGQETILLVDDEAIIRNLGKTILQRYGYRVLLAVDGVEAVEVYSAHRAEIDLVILDLTMPRLSGQDALRQLLQLDPEVRVLFSSGYSSELVTASDREGVLGFVNKPYRPHELARTIRTTLDAVR
ncbi:MAG: PAS domain S-box protein [Planctomycetia bacterium]|nr:PAS domain S-box protein [Planctomycetia bacterium]